MRRRSSHQAPECAPRPRRPPHPCPRSSPRGRPCARSPFMATAGDVPACAATGSIDARGEQPGLECVGEEPRAVWAGVAPAITGSPMPQGDGLSLGTAGVIVVQRAIGRDRGMPRLGVRHDREVPSCGFIRTTRQFTIVPADPAALGADRGRARTWPRRLAAMLRPDHARARRDNAPEAMDVGAPQCGQRRPQDSWALMGERPATGIGGRPRRRQGGPSQMPKGVRRLSRRPRTPVVGAARLSGPPGGARSAASTSEAVHRNSSVSLSKARAVVGWRDRLARAGGTPTHARLAQLSLRPAVPSHSAPIGPSG